MEPLLLHTLENIRQDIQELRAEVHALNQWKARVIGGSFTISAIITVVFNVAQIIMKG